MRDEELGMFAKWIRFPDACERWLYELSARKVPGVDCSPPRCLLVKFPFWWGCSRGLTLGPVVLVVSMDDASVVVHEMVHVSQFYRAPFLFYPRYVWRFLVAGYDDHEDEIEARVMQMLANSFIGRGKCARRAK